jgi:hypothetical protein
MLGAGAVLDSEMWWRIRVPLTSGADILERENIKI